jgi:hypothetical protein
MLCVVFQEPATPAPATETVLAAPFDRGFMP